MRTGLLSHPCDRRVCTVFAQDCERELKPLKVSLKIRPALHKNRCIYRRFSWRRGSESAKNYAYRLWFCQSLSDYTRGLCHYIFGRIPAPLLTLLLTVALAVGCWPFYALISRLF